MSRPDPNAEGESPGSRLGASIALLAGLGLLVALALLLHTLIPGGIRS